MNFEKIYVVLRDECDEPSTLVGVYETKEKAQDAVEKSLGEHKLSPLDFSIEETVVL